MSFLNYRARNGRLKKGMLLGAVLGAFTVSATVPPAWWDTYGLTNSNPPNDNAVATQGQAKHAVDSARQYLNAELAPIGGAGAQLEDMVTESWFTDLTKNNYVVTNSQLKNLAAPFYDRLNAVGFNAWPTGMIVDANTGYPWTVSTSDDAPNSPATLGQIKFLYSIEITEIPTENRPDYELPYVRMLTPGFGQNLTTTHSVSLSAEAKFPNETVSQVVFYVDGVQEGTADLIDPYDGVWDPSNGQTYVLHAAATDGSSNVVNSPEITIHVQADLDSDGLGDNWESATSITDPNDDADGDGLLAIYEYRLGTDPNAKDNQLVGLTYFGTGI